MAQCALLVDDHPVIRGALVASLVSLGIFESIDTTDSFNKLIDTLVRDAAYHLLILDLSLTDISGSRGVAYIREHYPDIPIMVFSGNDTTDVIAECFEYGVHGFVSKSAPMPGLEDIRRSRSSAWLIFFTIDSPSSAPLELAPFWARRTNSLNTAS